ncbi:MAG: hypothetical protein Q8L79_03325 [Methylobacter sp.]|uniref:hypothetical protein n=1 Tax=Methylobacter sp. TaxID=2051955 RepID=UPI0027308777|nr:hypothetical protein [Methylobacter sp.]MDP1664133.1 hypothetical protein [Methylobacter sp.]
MASKYAQIADCIDPSVTVTQVNVEEADVYVDGELWAHGINPDDVTLPNARLKTLAVTWAIRVAAIQGAMGDNSLLIDKAKEYQKTADLLAKQITRESLGLTVAVGAGFGSITLGRG